MTIAHDIKTCLKLECPALSFNPGSVLNSKSFLKVENLLLYGSSCCGFPFLLSTFENQNRSCVAFMKLRFGFSAFINSEAVCNMRVYILQSAGQMWPLLLPT